MTQRSFRLILLSHCILNQNAVVQPLARQPGGLLGIVHACLEAGVGIVQLPCPEMLARGPERAQAERAEYDTAEFRAVCRQSLVPIRDQVRAYERAGYTIVGFIGVGNSPSCGVTTTHEGGQAVPGQGVFVEELLALLPELAGRALQVPKAYGRDPEATARFDDQVRAWCAAPHD